METDIQNREFGLPRKPIPRNCCITPVACEGTVKAKEECCFQTVPYCLKLSPTPLRGGPSGLGELVRAAPHLVGIGRAVDVERAAEHETA